ncbi:hypothetical protein Patl1_27527 [Pistacia atlantica]|uniref:Uncharacterized protein n=1 Tax=Pistacia atlantica TaxID=434234 RepID=A0ACC1BF62_9ROSI|nr:hypothetical protein Patl1_27527 [Pistacia atlantica]
MASNNKVSNFFKQYVPKHGKDGLGIPDAFVEHLNGSPKKAVLRNWMGEIWYVEIGYTDAEKFVEDTIVIKVLMFKIFGKSACEKREINSNAGIDVEVKRKEDDVFDVDDDKSDDFIANEEENIEEGEEEASMNHRAKRSAEIKKSLSCSMFHHVLKEIGLKLAEIIAFHDKHRQIWPGKVVHSLGGRTLINGWRAFSRWNNVDKDDLCICEFPTTEGEERDIIEVHIARGCGSRSRTRTDPN